MKEKCQKLFTQLNTAIEKALNHSIQKTFLNVFRPDCDSYLWTHNLVQLH